MSAPPPSPPPPEPRPAREPSSVGSLVRTVVILALAVLAFTGLFRACSFSPTTPDIDRSTLPRIDAAAAIDTADVPFPKRTPQLPSTWISQSSDVASVGAARVLRVGWVTPDNTFLRLVQSDLPEAVLVEREQGDPAAEGTVPAGGAVWTVHEGVRSEAMWVHDTGAVRLLVTGDASPERFSELAAATLAAPPTG